MRGLPRTKTTSPTTGTRLEYGRPYLGARRRSTGVITIRSFIRATTEPRSLDRSPAASTRPRRPTRLATHRPEFEGHTVDGYVLASTTSDRARSRAPSSSTTPNRPHRPKDGSKKGTDDCTPCCGGLCEDEKRRADAHELTQMVHSFVVSFPVRRFASWPIRTGLLDAKRGTGDQPGRRDRTLRLAFVSAVVSLVAAFAAVGSTIPLVQHLPGRGRVHQRRHLDDRRRLLRRHSQHTAGAGTTVQSSWADGPSPSPASDCSCWAVCCCLNVHDIGILIAGRLLMGLGAGLASSSLTSYIVDAAPARPAWLASVASSQTVMLGLAVGAIASGALVQFGPWPRDLIYLVVVGLLLLSAALVAISPETVTPTPGGWRSLRPQRSRTGPSQASAPRRGSGVPGHLGDRGLLPGLRARAGRRSTPHQQLARPRTGVRRVHGPQRSGRSPRRPVLTGGSSAPRHDRLPGRMDRPHHSDHHRHTAVVHRRNHRRRRQLRASPSAPPPGACCTAAPWPTGHRSSPWSTSSATAARPFPASSPPSSPTSSPSRRSPSDTAHLPSSPPCSLSSPHATRTPARPGTAR